MQQAHAHRDRAGDVVTGGWRAGYSAGNSAAGPWRSGGARIGQPGDDVDVAAAIVGAELGEGGGYATMNSPKPREGDGKE